MYLNIAKISLLINAALSILVVPTRAGLSLGEKTVVAVLLFALIAVGIVSLRRFEETRSRKAAYAALVSFILFFPIGLIGVYAVKKLLAEGQTAADSDGRKGPLAYMTLPFTAALFLGLLAGAFISDYFYTVRNLERLIVQCAWPCLIAFAILSAAANDDADMAAPWLASLAAVIIALTVRGGSPWTSGLLLALAAAAALGAASGALVAATALPAIAVTLIAGLGIQGADYMLTGLQSIPAAGVPAFANDSGGAIGIIALGLLLCFGARSLAARVGSIPLKRILSFAFGGVIAALAGFALLSRLQAATPTMGGNATGLVLLVFFWVRSFGKRGVGRWAVLLALAPALLYAVTLNLFSLNNVGIEAQILAQALMALLFMLTSAWDTSERRPGKAV